MVSTANVETICIIADDVNLICFKGYACSLIATAVPAINAIMRLNDLIPFLIFADILHINGNGTAWSGKGYRILTGCCMNCCTIVNNHLTAAINRRRIDRSV